MHYFAYGSLMSPLEINRTCQGDISNGEAAWLDDYRLAFTRLSHQWGGGVADVIPAPGMRVWGVLYWIDNLCRVALDLREGNGIAYQREQLPVTRPAGDTVNAIVYRVINRKETEVRPVHDYLNAIQHGAENAQLPADYRDFIDELWHECTEPTYRGGLLLTPGQVERGIIVHPADAPTADAVRVRHADQHTIAPIQMDPDQPRGTCRAADDVRQALNLSSSRYGATLRLND